MKKPRHKVAIYDANDARAIPMDRLLDALGIKHSKRGQVTCPFPDHHKHGDAHPSARVYVKKNKLHCFVSGESWSTIDLVMQLKGVSNGDAIKWLGETFQLRQKESRISFRGKGKSSFTMRRRIVDLKQKRKPTTIEQILHSPGYRDLKAATVKVGLMLLAQMPDEDPVVEVSQRELAGMAGYEDSEPIKRAIDELQGIGILAVQKHGNKRTTFRATPLDPAFRRWLETGKPSDPASGNPGQNTGTVDVCIKGSGETVSDDELQSWCSAADQVMKDFYSWPPEFHWTLTKKPELETLRRWLAGKPRDLTLHAVRLFAQTERTKGTHEVCRRFVHARNRYLKLAQESPLPPTEEPRPELPNSINKGKLLDWFDQAAKTAALHDMRFENTLTREEEDTFRQWIGTHKWGFTIGAIHHLAEGGGKTSSDACRLYFEKRDYFYGQELASLDIPVPASPSVEPGRSEEGKQ